MREIQNSIRQMLRAPVRTVLFLLLLVLSVCLLTLGVHLQMASEAQMQAYEATFTTIGTVRQVENILETQMLWDAGLKSYSYYNSPVYDSILPVSILDFEGADYVHPPEKRPYYSAYVPGLTLSAIGEHEALRTNAVESGSLIVELQPLEDCVPDRLVRMKVCRVLHGDLGIDEIWFCVHNDKDPPPLFANKKYVMMIYGYPLSYAHPEEFGETYEYEYRPINAIISDQVDKNGVPVADGIEENPYWEEVTEGYYNTSRGRRWKALMDGYELLKYTIPVTPTSSTGLLMAFYNGSATIGDGRDITEEEYNAGERVCLIPRTFAKNNGLTTGDTLTLSFYSANYRSVASQDFSSDGWGIHFWGPINAQGESYPFFDSGAYTIVGIYDIAGSGYESTDFKLGGNEIIIPSTSVKNSDENNIVAYGPMKAYNTSFQIPNGSIESFLKEWNKLGITNLDIQFYDNGYTRLMAGLDAMKNVSLVFLLTGTATTLLILIFFTYLFISKQKKRTAVERSLGLSKTRCGLSLLTGMMLIVLLGSLVGGVAGYLVSGAVQEQVMDAGKGQTFDTMFSNWVNNADTQTKIEIGIEKPNPTGFAAMGLIVIAVAVLLALIGIRGNLRHEPLRMLSTRNE